MKADRKENDVTKEQSICLKKKDVQDIFFLKNIFFFKKSRLKIFFEKTGFHPCFRPKITFLGVLDHFYMAPDAKKSLKS